MSGMSGSCGASGRSAAAQCARRLAADPPEPLAPYLEHVWLGMPAAIDGEAVPLAALAARRGELLDAMAAIYGGDRERHARALLSQWSKYCFALAAPAAVYAATLGARVLDLAPERTALVLRDGMPAALVVAPDALGGRADDPARRYAPLVAHLRAIVDALAAMAPIAPRVLWSNAGNLLDYLLGSCAALPGGERAADDAAWLFAAREGNPLRMPVRDVTPRSPRLPNPFRARRVCCVRFEIPGETQLCASCPLLLTMSDEALARQDAAR